MYDDVTTIRPPTMNIKMKMNVGERQSFGSRQAGVRISRLFWLGPHYFTPMQGHLESLGPADVRHSGFDWLFDRLYDWRASSPCGPPTIFLLLTSRALKTTRRQTNSGTICCAPLLSALPRHPRVGHGRSASKPASCPFTDACGVVVVVRFEALKRRSSLSSVSGSTGAALTAPMNRLVRPKTTSQTCLPACLLCFDTLYLIYRLPERNGCILLWRPALGQSAHRVQPAFMGGCRLILPNRFGPDKGTGD